MHESILDEILKTLDGLGFELRQNDAPILAAHGMVYYPDADEGDEA